MRVSQITRKGIISFAASLLIALFAIQIINQSAFIHTHRLEGNRILIHAHPFHKEKDSGPVKSHHHSQSEILFFISLGILFPFVFLSLATVNVLPRKNLPVYYIILLKPTRISFKKGRSPPVL